jgi:hypothetical protein
MKYTATKHIEQIKAATLSSLLFISALGVMCYAFSQNRNLILGTELHGNSSVEFLCLGSECKNLTRFSLRD